MPDRHWTLKLNQLKLHLNLSYYWDIFAKNTKFNLGLRWIKPFWSNGGLWSHWNYLTNFTAAPSTVAIQLFCIRNRTRGGRGGESNKPLRLKEFPRAKPEKTSEGEGVDLTIYPESSPNTDSSHVILTIIKRIFSSLISLTIRCILLRECTVNKPAAQAAGADPTRWSSTKRQNPPIQQNRRNFWTSSVIWMPFGF